MSTSATGAVNVSTGVVDVTTPVGGYGIGATTTNSSLTINASTIHGHNAGVMGVSGFNASASGATNITVGSIDTVGAGSVGISSITSGSGTVTITSGAVSGSTHTGGITTTGNTATGIDVSSGSGLITINSNGVIQTTGVGAGGIAVAGSGTVAVNNWSTATTGTTSHAIQVNTTGAVTVSSTTATATGTGSDAIHVNGGAVTVNVADAGAATSTSGYGVWVNATGAATINAGATTGTSTVSGGTYGIFSTATGGTTVNIHATVTGGSGAAINLKGGASTINNFSNTIIGFVNLTPANDVLNNSGTWTAFGTSDFGGGTDTVNNSGFLNVTQAASVATTTAFNNLEVFNNSGTIDLRQTGAATPHTGDVLNLGAAAFVGSGASTLAVDANLSGAAAGASAANSADQLTVGAASGTTTIVLNDVGAANASMLNFTGIRVVNATSSTAGAFVLSGGAFVKGLTVYKLVADGTNFDLVGLPTNGVFQFTKVGDKAQSFWRRSGDAWSEEMRTRDGKPEGVRMWGHLSAASDNTDSNPTYTATGLTTFTFTPDLKTKTSWVGGQVGIDTAQGDWVLGVTAGYGDQRSRFSVTRDHIDLTGYNIGAYANYRKDGFFVGGLAKYDSYDVKLKFGSASFNNSSNGSSYGIELQTGYHAVMGRGFIEPVAAISFTTTDLDDLVTPQGNVTYGHTDSTFGSIGLRGGLDHTSANMVWTPYAGVYVEGELGSSNKTSFATGAVGLANMEDDTAGGTGRVELGITGRSTTTGMEGYAKLDGNFGGDISGIAAKFGLSWRW